MPEYRKALAAKHLISGAVIAVVWYLLSSVLALVLAGAEDNPNMTATVPWPLRLACAVVFFPMRYVGYWDKPPRGMSDDGYAAVIRLEFLANALFWGFLLVALYSLMGRLRIGGRSER
jgi:hypothetical protein